MDIERLVVDHFSWLRRKALLFCQNEIDAEDLASETAEKLLRSRVRFDTRKEFKPWALVVMRNTFITQYNRRKCVPFTSMDDNYPYPSSCKTDQELAVANIFSTIRACARKSIAIECVILYAKGYNYEEISKMLGIPKGTVMSRISNGRKMLRDALGG